MAIPYNPSSFATNKTILQAIEELKNYLKQNPCYKVYYVGTAYVVGTTTYNLSDVDDPDDTMTAGDIVFFNNSYYASVTVKDTNTFDIDPAVDFRGATGSTGAQGVSVTGATINASGHLIISLSDGTSIDAGYLPANYDNTVELTATSGTLSDDDFNKLLSDDSHIKYGGQLYYKESGGSASMKFFHLTSGGHTASRQVFTITNSTKAYAWSDHVFAVDEDCISATNVAGEVLMSNGDGTASWGTVSTGYENTVTISTTSGTFSNSDFAKLGYGDSTIIYNDGTIKSTYRLKLDTASILEFECIDATSKNNLKLIDINKGTKAYSMTSVAMIKSATFDSGTATAGKVLTANGSGGTSWETAGGGGSQLYRHSFWVSQTNAYTYFVSVITNSSTPWTHVSDFIAYLTNNGHTTQENQFVDIKGIYKSGTTLYEIFGIYVSGGNKYIHITNISTVDGSFQFYNSYFNESLTITDTVVAL